MTNEATGRRRKRERKFVTIENSMFEDSRLSWKAKGLLGYLLTKPDGWIVRVPDLLKHATDGDKSVRTAVKELRKYGYLTIQRVKKDNGHWAGTVWEYDDVPMFDVDDVEEEPQTLEPQGIDPYADFRHVVDGHVEKGTYISNTDSSNTYISNIKDIDDDDKKRTDGSLSHNDENIDLTISNLREATKEELTDRSFNAVVRRVVDKYKQGKINSFRDYLVTALSNKIEELELRKLKDEKQQEARESIKEEAETRLMNVDHQRKVVEFYDWLEERE